MTSKIINVIKKVKSELFKEGSEGEAVMETKKERYAELIKY